jgi:Tol biopolymer transport system component
MVRSIHERAARLTLLGLAEASALIGCGGAGNGQQAAQSSPGDGGPNHDATSGSIDRGDGEAGSGDAGAFGDGGVSCIEGGAGPKGAQLAKSSTASILGLTDDDQVVYVETASSTLFAVPAAGGAAASIGPTEGSVAVASKAVFNWTGLNQDGTVSSGLQVWTAARGTHSLAGTSLVGLADSSADGSKLLYFDDASGSAADLYVAAVDGSSKTRLATGVSWTQSCMPQVSFVGSSALLGYCTAAPPSAGGPPVGTLALYVGASGTGMTLSTGAVLSSIQTAGTNILYSAPGGLMLADATTGATNLVDATGGTSAAFTHDGQSLVYVTTDGSLKRSPVVSPRPVTLVAAGGFDGVSSVSPDDRWLLASKTRDPDTGDVDIYIASASAGGSAAAILGSATGSFYGSPFTADSSRVLYVDNAMNGAGDYHVVPTAGGPGFKLASRMWIGFATTGTRVVYEDGFVPGVGLGAHGIADIESVDVSAMPPTPVVLVNQADPNLYFTSAGDRLVYSLTFCAAGSEGIWVMPTP